MNKTAVVVASAIAVAIAGITVPFVDPPIFVGGGGNPVVTVIPNGGNILKANVWIAPDGQSNNAGSNCTRSSSAVVEPSPTSSVCSTPQKACSLANGGDIIGVSAGTYTVPFTLTSACAPASTVTFQNQPGAFVTFAPDGSIGAVTNITLQGDQIGQGVGFSLGKMTITNAVNLTWKNINQFCLAASPYHVLSYTGTANYCNASVTISGDALNNFTWNGGDSGNWRQCVFTGCVNQANHNEINGSSTGEPHNILIENVTFHDITQLTQADHSEMWKVDSVNGLTFTDDRFLKCLPPPGIAVVGCDTAVVSMDECGSCATTPDNVTFIQDIIDPGSVNGQKDVAWASDVPAGTEYHLTLKYNTFVFGSLSLCGVLANFLCKHNSGTITGSNILAAGNIAIRTGACGSAETASHNVWYTLTASNASKCNATDTQLTNTILGVIWAAAGPPSYNQALATLSPALNAGENTYCPVQDINGVTRPTLNACDDGAIQH